MGLIINPYRFSSNYDTWNPSDKNAGITLSGANLIETSAAAAQAVRSVIGKSSGKWLAEITVGSGAGATIFGLGTSTATLANYPGFGADSWAYFGVDGKKYTSNAGATYGATYTNGDVISLAWDATGGKLYFAKNGVWQASGDPAAGTNPAYSGLSGSLFLMIAGASAAQSATLNAGQSPFTVAVPSGFSGWSNP